jgi:putative endonuclease
VYFVYILQSLSSRRFYVGHCDNLVKRFRDHQRGFSPYTRCRGAWCLPCYESLPTRPQAMKREQQIKRLRSAKTIRRLISNALPGLELR